jgi:hypothetical protein
MKTVYQTDENGIFVGTTTADPSPLEEGVWLIPNGCVEDPPPNFTEGQFLRWVGQKWQVEEIPTPQSETVAQAEPEAEPEPQPSPEEAHEIKTLRHIEEIKQLLQSTDYVALPDYDKQKPDVLAQRQQWRDQIRMLGQTLAHGTEY